MEGFAQPFLVLPGSLFLFTLLLCSASKLGKKTPRHQGAKLELRRLGGRGTSHQSVTSTFGFAQLRDHDIPEGRVGFTSKGCCDADSYFQLVLNIATAL